MAKSLLCFHSTRQILLQDCLKTRSQFGSMRQHQEERFVVHPKRKESVGSEHTLQGMPMRRGMMSLRVHPNLDGHISTYIYTQPHYNVYFLLSEISYCTVRSLINKLPIRTVPFYYILN
jgi:hypothetical protein